MKRGAFVVLGVMVLTLVAVSISAGGGIRSEDPDATAATFAPTSRPADAFALTITYVYDGDTVQAQVQAPNDVVTADAPIRIRLIGVDTPEGVPEPQCWANQARAHLAAMLPEGSTAWAAADRESQDRYARRLLYLWTDDGRFVNLELVAAGDAEVLRVWPNVAHEDDFAAAEATARAAGVGRWGACG